MSRVLLLCDDLLFGSKVTATARAQRLDAVVARTPEVAVARLYAGGFGCAILDLHLSGLVIDEFVPAAKAVAPATRLIGFGSHVDADRLKAARHAGVELVLPRSQFAKDLEAKLAGWAAMD